MTGKQEKMRRNRLQNSPVRKVEAQKQAHRIHVQANRHIHSQGTPPIYTNLYNQAVNIDRGSNGFLEIDNIMRELEYSRVVSEETTCGSPENLLKLSCANGNLNIDQCLNPEFNTTVLSNTSRIALEKAFKDRCNPGLGINEHLLHGLLIGVALLFICCGGGCAAGYSRKKDEQKKSSLQAPLLDASTTSTTPSVSTHPYTQFSNSSSSSSNSATVAPIRDNTDEMTPERGVVELGGGPG